MKVNDLAIPRDYRNSHCKKRKKDKAREYLLENGELDKPITVYRGTRIVIDGLSRYIALKQLFLGEEELIRLPDLLNGNKQYTYKF